MITVRSLLAGCLLLLAAGWQAADAADADEVGVRVGAHPAFDRIVFDLPPGRSPQVSVHGGHADIRFGDATALVVPAHLPARVAGMTAADGRADIVLVPGASFRISRLGARLIVDIQTGRTAADAPRPPAPRPRPASAAPAATRPAAPAPTTTALPAPARAASGTRPSAPPSATQAAAATATAATAPAAAPAAALSVPVPSRPPVAALPPVPASPDPVPPRTIAAPPLSVIPAMPAPPDTVAADPAGAAPPPVTPRLTRARGTDTGAKTEAEKETGPAPAAASGPASDGAEPVHRKVRGILSDDAPAPAASPVAAGFTPVPVDAEPLTAPAAGPPADAALAWALRPVRLADDAAGSPGLALPFDGPVAAAAFRRGGSGYVVFDQARPLDMAALRDDPVFGGASVSVLPAGTLLRLPLAPGRALALAPSARAWVVRVVPLSVPGHPIDVRDGDRRLLFGLDEPGGAIVVPDGDTGALLLVGTQRRAGEGVAGGRRTPAFALLPTWQGLVVEPYADALRLRPAPDGFALGASDGEPLPSLDGATAEGAASLLTRRYDIPTLPPDALLRHLQTEILSAAAAPPLARTPLRSAVAQTMIALGLGAEAQGVLEDVAADDPRAAADPGQAGLAAIAALLAGRWSESAGLDDPRLADTDEIALWRAVRLAEHDEASPAAAAALAHTLPLILAYPSPLRDRLLPLAAEVLARAGHAAQAARLLAGRGDDHRLDLARAMLAEARGDVPLALASYDRLATGGDRLLRARAGRRAVELRLATHRLDARGAAAALERQLMTWRGDGRELALRRRIAELQADSGAWRAALAGLRATARDFPDSVAVPAQARAVFARFADDAGALPPLDYVSLIDENADLLPGGAAGEALSDRLAARLVQLDLPSRAIPVLEKLIRHAPGAVARAGFGARLAALRLAAGDAAGAQDALTRTDAASLPPPLAARRAVLAARIALARGDRDAAVRALAAVDTADAADLRASILEETQDWPQAEAALRPLADPVLSASAPPDAGGRRILLRYAAAAAQAHDAAALTQLREAVLPRLPPGGDADMLRLLTAAPVTGTGDLARARAELAVARNVAGDEPAAAGAPMLDAIAAAPKVAGGIPGAGQPGQPGPPAAASDPAGAASSESLPSAAASKSPPSAPPG